MLSGPMRSTPGQCATWPRQPAGLTPTCATFPPTTCSPATKPSPTTNGTSPDPRSVYGASKLAGEQEAGSAATVVRTSWLCGRQGSNVVATVLRLAAEGGPLRFVSDQRGSPSFTSDVAAVIERLCVDRSPGLYHVTNQGEVSWYEFAREIMAAAGHDPDRVAPIETAELDPPPGGTPSGQLGVGEPGAGPGWS